MKANPHERAEQTPPPTRSAAPALSPSAIGIRDLATALLLAVALFALYRATAQDFLFDDGASMAALVSAEGRRFWHHLLLFPFARLFQGLANDPSMGGVEALLLVSSVSMSVGLAACHLMVCSLGTPRRHAVLITALLGLAPACWFHGTVVEAHALHGGLVCVAALFARVGGRFASTPMRTAIALAICGTVAAVAVLGHLTSLLAAGGLAWIFVWSKPTSERRTASRQFFEFVIASAVIGLCMAATYRYGARLFGASVDRDSIYPLSVLTGYGSFATTPIILWRDWIPTWPAAIAFATFALVVKMPQRRFGSILAFVGVLPTLVMTTHISVSSRGGYALGVLPFVALLVALGVGSVGARFGTRAATIVLVHALALHGILATRLVFEPQGRAIGAMGVARAEDMRILLPNGGTLVSWDRHGQLVSARNPAVVELALFHVAPNETELGGRPPEEIATLVNELARQLAVLVGASPGAVVWDRTWNFATPESSSVARAWLLPIEHALASRFDVLETTIDDRAYWILRPFATDPTDE